MPASSPPFLARSVLGVSPRIGAYFGDSITANGLQANSANDRRRSTTGFTGWLPFLTRGRIISPLANNFGVNGNTTTQMLARTPAVLAARPSWCTVLGGTNDLTNGGTVATITANLKAIYDLLQAAGITIIAIPILGRNLTGSPLTDAQAGVALAVNRWIRMQRRTRRNFYVADCQLAFDDPANTAGASVAFVPRNAFTSDGLHPQPAGAFAIATEVARILNALYPDPYLPIMHGADLYSASNPTGSLVAGGLMLGTGGSPGTGFTGQLATGWSSDPVANLGGAAGAFSKVTRADGRTFQRLDLSGNYNTSNGFIDIVHPIGAGTRAAILAGDTIEASAEAFFDGGMQNFAGVSLSLQASVAGAFYQVNDLWTNNAYAWPSGPIEGVYSTPSLVLPGTPDALSVRLQVALKSVSASSPVVAGFSFGSVEVRRVI